MLPSLETERMWARRVRLENAEQVQKIFPQWEIVKHLGAMVLWP
jgi:ribosomal-protein-alanine N-acetyltransferase